MPLYMARCFKIDSKLRKMFEKREPTDFRLALVLSENAHNNYDFRTFSGVILTA